MEYKVGDKVRVRPDLKHDYYRPTDCHVSVDVYPGIGALLSMCSMAGKIVTIKNVRSHSYGWKYYQIIEDNGTNYWADTMFCHLFIDSPSFKLLI